MENAADALKMAGAVLLFVLALSVIIFSFGQVRETADTILDYKDRETSYINGNNYYTTTGTERQVGLETIIPSIYRAYIEEYKIVLDGLKEPIYKIKINGEWVDKYTLDLETAQNKIYSNVSFGAGRTPEEFIKGILYGEFEGGQTAFEKKYNIKLAGDSLYSRLSKASMIKEYLGVYYQNDDENIPDVNKNEKRIITYKITY